MEEKERYYIEHDMIIDEDKRTNGEQDITICDTDDIDRVVYLLNQQDKRIKELEEELDDAKRDYIPKLEFGLQRANKLGRDAGEAIPRRQAQVNQTCHAW